jgi:HPt (histidine-containing phosphotransfer) domain-containing protein
LHAPQDVVFFLMVCGKSKVKTDIRKQYAWCATTSWCQTMECSLMKNTVCEAVARVPAWKMEEALLAMDGNPELLVRVARLLLKQLDADLPLIRQYVQAQETQLLKDRSHRLKGSLSAIAATPAFDACDALNDLATAARTQCYPDGLDRLEFEVARLRPYVTKPFKSQDLYDKVISAFEKRNGLT